MKQSPHHWKTLIKMFCNDDDNDDTDPFDMSVCMVCEERGRDNERWFR
jgi:hypothetical protein